jgi:hypothetical protein
LARNGTPAPAMARPRSDKHELAELSLSALCFSTYSTASRCGPCCTDALIQDLDRLALRDPCSRLPCDDYDIQTWPHPWPLVSKPLANPPFYSISRGCVPHTTAYGDSQTYPPVLITRLGGCYQHHKTPHTSALTIPRYVSKLLMSQKTIRPLERPCRDTHYYFEEVTTASRRRPLARRRFKIARPARVFIRARKPCVRSRRTRLG